MKTIKKLTLSIGLFILILIISNKVYAAATTSLNASSTNVVPGTSVKITAGVNSAEVWNLKLSASGGNLTGTTSDAGAPGQEVTQTALNATFSASTPGTYIINLTGEIAGSDLVKQSVNKSITITVANPTTTPTTTPSTAPSAKPSPVTLTFSGSSETVYAISDVNVRSNYSTSASSLGKLKAGESITRTGVSNATADGYYWSKVSFNGATGYIASKYLSKTKPEIQPSAEPTSPTGQGSSDATLKSLSINGVEISPKFSPTITNYVGTIADEVVEVTVLAEVNSEKAKYEIKGNKELQDGENIVKIIVTAEDGTVNTYEVSLTKGAQNKSAFVIVGIKENDERVAIALGEPIILENVVEYGVKLEEWLKAIEIVSTINDETITFEGLGTFDLNVGENKFIVKVTQSDEVTEYIITINNPEKVVKATNDNNKKGTDNKKIAIGAGIAAVAVVGILGVIIYYKKQHVVEYGKSDYSFYNKNDDYGNDRGRRGGKHF